ncbi:lamin tail domain-containing protein 2 isoform X7 [Callithrix jacchus]
MPEPQPQPGGSPGVPAPSGGRRCGDAPALGPPPGPRGKRSPVGVGARPARSKPRTRKAPGPDAAHLGARQPRDPLGHRRNLPPPAPRRAPTPRPHWPAARVPRPPAPLLAYPRGCPALQPSSIGYLRHAPPRPIGSSPRPAPRNSRCGRARGRGLDAAPIPYPARYAETRRLRPPGRRVGAGVWPRSWADFLSRLPVCSQRTSRMAPKSGPGAEEAKEEALSSSTDRESVSGHLGPPAGTPAASATSMTRVACSANPQLAPESLDPRTLRLLWGQRELEIQALRWAVRNGRDTRLWHILQEVAGLPPKRSSHSQERLLQSQVQKLTLQLKEQKEQAQWEKEYLEEQLLETTRRLQEVEAELQNFQKSCLLQLARSSWVGRMLQSQTGSVEVVMAGTLMDPSDLSENIQAPTGEGFRLEKDWNSIARRYPNLFTNVELDSQQKQPWPWPQLDTGSPGSPGKHSEGHQETVTRGSLPCLGTSSSGGADSDSSSCQQGLPYHLLKASRHSPRGWGASSEKALVQARSFGRGSEDLQKTQSARHRKPVLTPELCTDPDYPGPEHQQSPTGSCLKIVAVSVREKLVRILNQSQLETADLGGAVLKQLVRGRPERLYRFPPATLLAPRHHITIWGEGPRNAKKPPCASSGREPQPSHSSPDCVTLLLGPKGEVLSEHRIPHCATPAPRVFADDTDLSIDRFPLPEAGPGADPCEPPGTPRRGRVRESRVGRRPRTRALQPPPSSGKRFHPREGPAQHLPAIPRERTPEGERGPPDPTPPSPPADAGLGLEDWRLLKEHRVRVCRKSVDRSCPMVALSVPSTAQSRYGFRFLNCLPFTMDSCRRA